MPTRKIGAQSTRIVKYNPLLNKRWVTTAVVTYLLLVLVSSSGCSVQKHLDKSKPLYEGSAIRITNAEVLPDEKALMLEIQSRVQQESVRQIAMWWWIKMETTKEKGIKKSLRNILGKPPSYYNPAKSNLSLLLMRDYFKDHGYFGASVRCDTLHTDAYHILDSFIVTAAPRARIDTIVWPSDTSALGEFLDLQKPRSYLKKGDFYSVSTLDAERARLDQLSSRQGFFDFAMNNIFYIVDSTSSIGNVAVYMRLSEGSDSLAFNQFRIGNTYVYPNFSRLVDYSGPEADSVMLNGLSIIQHSLGAIKPKELDRRIGLRSGMVYDHNIYENTLNQLLDLGVYKYVNYEFKRRMTDSTPVLDQFIYLTQGTTREFRSNLEATTRTGALLGLGATGSYSDKSLFNGAEDFTVSLSAAAGPQTSIADANETIIAREFGLSVELALPRFVGPFRKYVERTAYYIPRTIFSARYQLLDRSDFGLQTTSIRLGYRYRANRYATHELYPLSINYNRVISTSDEFNQALDDSDRLAQSFSDNAVLGLEYIFRYSDQQIVGRRSYWFIEGSIKSAGNLAILLAGDRDAPGLPRDFLNVQVSQFFRAHVDARRTLNFRESSLASRVYLGAAIPFGNSDVVPYADQFFAGGPNSVRAFPIRGLGPGASLPATQSSTSALNQTGDIRFELNTEYRFPIWSFFEGATFVDAGNVWLYNDIDNDTPEGVFEFDEFYKQIAVGTGLGLRINLDFLILRADVSVPIYKPWLSENDRWDFNALNILDATSREEDLQFQVAIGYPF